MTPDTTIMGADVTSTDAPGASRPTRTLVQLVRGLRFGTAPVCSGTTDAETQTRESGTLPAFATTRTTESRFVGGRTEVDPGGGSCRVVVVVVAIVGVVVVVVDVVVDDDVPGIVVEVVVDVVVDVDVVVEVPVVVGRPVIRTTGGWRLTATITRSCRTWSLGVLAS